MEIARALTIMALVKSPMFALNERSGTDFWKPVRIFLYSPMIVKLTLKQVYEIAPNPRRMASEKTLLRKVSAEKKPRKKPVGQVFAFGKEGSDASGVSIPIRGPVTIRSAFSIEPVSITSTQITKSVSGEGDGSKRGSDTMGMKHRVDQGVYVCYGSMNPQLAERTGFSDEDAESIKAILPRLFQNGVSAARPDGSMQILTAFWWKHKSKAGQYSSAKVHQSLIVNADGSYELKPLDGLDCEVIDGF
jgi:CRISPR-associated protein Csd2